MPNLGIPELLIFAVPIAVVALIVAALRNARRTDSPASPTSLQLGTPTSSPMAPAPAPPLPQPTGPAPPASNGLQLTYYTAGPTGEVSGPSTEATLREWLQQGRISASTPICQLGDPKWVPISSHAAFGALFLPAVPPGLPPLPSGLLQPASDQAPLGPPFMPLLSPAAAASQATPPVEPLASPPAGKPPKTLGPINQFTYDHPVKATGIIFLGAFVLWVLASVVLEPSIRVGMTVNEVYAAMGSNPDWKGMSWEPGEGNVLVQRWGNTWVFFSSEGKVLYVKKE